MSEEIKSLHGTGWKRRIGKTAKDHTSGAVALLNI
jgi:hypothetical protein